MHTHGFSRFSDSYWCVFEVIGWRCFRKHYNFCVHGRNREEGRRGIFFPLCYGSITLKPGKSTRNTLESAKHCQAKSLILYLCQQGPTWVRDELRVCPLNGNTLHNNCGLFGSIQTHIQRSFHWEQLFLGTIIYMKMCSEFVIKVCLSQQTLLVHGAKRRGTLRYFKVESVSDTLD